MVYFFSIFGVWFVHSLLLDDNDHDHVPTSPEAPLLEEPPPANPSGPQRPPSRDALRELRVANDRLGKATTLDDAWGVADLLWRLTNDGTLTADMLRETRIGRTVGLFCKRTCGRSCGQAECDFCELIAAWKQMCWNEINRPTLPDTKRGGGGRRSSSPLRGMRGLPSIPELRPRTESTESQNSESDDLHHKEKGCTGGQKCIPVADFDSPPIRLSKSAPDLCQTATRRRK
jgi:hypothetical protein